MKRLVTDAILQTLIITGEPITREIIDQLKYGFCCQPPQKYLHLTQLNDVQILQAVIDEWLEKEWGYSLQELPYAADQVAEDLIPCRLFYSAMRTAIPLIHWKSVVEDETIAQQLKELRRIQ